MTDDLLYVNFAALERASADIQNAIAFMESELQSLESDAAPLVATWQGAARAAYDDRQAKWRAGAANLTMMLRDIRRALDESAADYAATEQHNAGLFG
jgi:early secretory antigenic target protein ESAT-6